MKCREHLFKPIFTDKVNGRAVIIVLCEKCGETKEIEKYVGDNNTSQAH